MKFERAALKDKVYHALRAAVQTRTAT